MPRPFSGGSNSVLNNWCWDNWTLTCKRMKVNTYLTSHTKINSKRIKDVSVRVKTIVLIEENSSKSS